MPSSLYRFEIDQGDDPGDSVATIVLWLLQVLYTPEGAEIAEILNDHLRDLAAHHGTEQFWQLVHTQSPRTV